MPHPIRLGFSPCPNDAFVFHALVHGLVAPNEVWDVVLEDVETLNGWAEEGRLEVAKVSYHAFGRIARNWWMLPAGRRARSRGRAP
jgi:Predicted periplasmic solute-binding protein